MRTFRHRGQEWCVEPAPYDEGSVAVPVLFWRLTDPDRRLPGYVPPLGIDRLSDQQLDAALAAAHRGTGEGF